MTPEQKTQVADIARAWLEEGNTRREIVTELPSTIFITSDWRPTEQEVSEVLDALGAADRVKPRKIRAHPLRLRPHGHEKWYVVPSDPDYAVSTHGRYARVTASTRSTPGKVLAPRHRRVNVGTKKHPNFQWLTFFRLHRNGKPVDLNGAQLLANAMRGSQKHARFDKTEMRSGPTGAVSVTR